MKIGISGSAVLSQTQHLDRLFRKDVQHIEIGMFESVDIGDAFIRTARRRGLSVGIHSPLVRGGSKYDLLETVDMHPDEAFVQIEQELAWCMREKASYLLVHFPFASHSHTQSMPLVTEGARRLGMLQTRAGVKVVCEPKLGVNHDPAGIGWLRTAPTRIFSKAGLGICWDVGDHLLAMRSEEDYFSQFARWRDQISVIHLHNVRLEKQGYRWTPPHPAKSVVNSLYDVGRIIRQFPEDVTLVSEFTPQQVTTPATVDTSFEFLKTITLKDKHA